MMTMVPLDVAACPDCDTPTATMTVHQPALFHHGGYGATRRTVVIYCPACWWEVITDISETRP
jgi:hypothetical protein